MQGHLKATDSIQKKCGTYLFKIIPITPDGPQNQVQKYTCLLCRKSITWGGPSKGYHNPMSHLLNKHKDSYMKELEDAMNRNGHLVQTNLSHFIDDKAQRMYNWLCWLADFDIPYTQAVLGRFMSNMSKLADDEYC